MFSYMGNSERRFTMTIVLWYYDYSIKGVNIMHKVIKYKQILLDNFYLDEQGEVRRSKDGYLSRFKKGDLAKFFEHTGYMSIQIPSIRNTVKKSHLVLLLSGYELQKSEEVDHIDGNKHNDHPSNLRAVTRRVNSCNRKMRSDNTSGITGIRWSDHHGHYVIRKTVKGVRINKCSKTLENAKKILAELVEMDADYTLRHGK